MYLFLHNFCSFFFLLLNLIYSDWSIRKFKLLYYYKKITWCLLPILLPFHFFLFPLFFFLVVDGGGGGCLFICFVNTASRLTLVALLLGHGIHGRSTWAANCQGFPWQPSCTLVDSNFHYHCCLYNPTPLLGSDSVGTEYLCLVASFIPTTQVLLTKSGPLGMHITSPASCQRAGLLT